MSSWEPTRHNNGEGRCFYGIERQSRKSPTGVVVIARMGEIRWATREVPVGALGTGQRRSREGWSRPAGMAEGRVVVVKPGNAGRAKAPCFET